MVERIDVAVENQMARRHHQNPLASELHLMKDVGRKHHQTILRNVADELAYLDDLHRVQAVSRLVQDDEGRFMDQCLCYADSLLVASGKVLYQPLAEMSDLAFFQCFVHGLAYAVHQAQICSISKVFFHSKIRQKRRFLWQKTYLFLGCDGISTDAVAVYENVAGGRCKRAANDVHYRGLSGSVGTEKTCDSASSDFERYIIYGFESP